MYKRQVVYYFFKRRSPLFGPSLFFLFLNLALLVPVIPGVWLPNLGIAMVSYLAVACSLGSMREGTRWLKVGNIDWAVASLILIAAVVGSSALLIWIGSFKPDLSGYLRTVPDVSSALLLSEAVVFSILNAAAEESVFRGIYWYGLERILSNSAAIILLQSLFFALSHYRGLPGGVVGPGRSSSTASCWGV